MNRTRSIAFYGLAIALAMILSYVETLLPYSFGVPGIKLGLPNLVIMVLLYTRGVKGAAMVSLIRVLLTALLFGNAMSLAYSIAGAVLSLAVMILLKKKKIFSVAGVSVSGGVCHNMGQIIAAMILLGSGAVAAYLPFLIISGTIAGIVIGVGASVVIKRVEKV